MDTRDWVGGTRAPVPDGYEDLIEAVRELQDRLAAAAPDASTVVALKRSVAALSRQLASSGVPESQQLNGRLFDVDGRGQSLVPVVRLLARDLDGDGDAIRGTVRFGRHYLGANGAVHGGAVALLFDELLGQLAAGTVAAVSRTAYLHVDFRSITPVERDLQVEARYVGSDQRKITLRGVIRDGERVCAEAEGLFVVLLPGQP